MGGSTRPAMLNTEPIFISLDQLVLLLFSLPSQEESPTTLQPELTSAEGNALRYAAGYVVRSIKEKQKKGKHPMREALLYGLSDMCLKDDADSIKTG